MIAQTTDLNNLPAFDASQYSSGAIGAALAASAAEIESYCSRIFEVGTYYEHYQAVSDQSLYLNQWPIISVQNILLCDQAVENFGISNNADALWRAETWGGDALNGYWREGAIYIEYTAGYEIIPADLVMANAQMAAEYLLVWGTQLTERERMGEYMQIAFKTKSGDPASILDKYRYILDRYKRII